MEPKIINESLAKDMLINTGITVREHEIGKGSSFAKVLTGLFMLNGLIFAHRYGLGDNKRFGALVLLGSFPLAYILSKYAFGDRKLAELGDQQ